MLVINYEPCGTVDVCQNLAAGSCGDLKHTVIVVASTHGVGQTAWFPLGWIRVGVVKRLTVRTGKLRRSLALHARPINLVVFQDSSSFERKPRLRVDFTLRCFQRLFFPDLATLRCP